MPIEFMCECGQRLKVADANAGKRAKCPKCKSEQRVPAASTVGAPSQPAFSTASASAAPPAANNAAMWTVQTGEGEQYGPITKAELEQWMAEGRLDDNCQILREGWDQWKWASEVYPSLGGGQPAKSDNPFDFTSAPASSGGYSSGRSSGGYAPAYSGTLRPHRGSTIKILGILSFVVNPCFILSVMAWTMGNTDLEEMRRGRMDPSGRSDTETGRLCGMISLGLGVFGTIIFVFLMLAVGVANVQ
jgi:hypothetical protein